MTEATVMTDDLPPLPEPDAVIGYPEGIDRAVWFGESMAAYARAAVEAHRAEHGMAAHEFRPTIDKALAELDAREKIELLRELLREALPGLQGLRPRRRQGRSDEHGS
jgi:hypothetical protein